MSLRRRLALFLDPALTPPSYEPLRLNLGDHRLSGEVSEVVRELHELNRQIRTRPPRIIECAHPELHSPDEPFDETDFTQFDNGIVQ